MAKYPQPKIIQAALTNVPKHIALPRLKYVITAKTSEAKSTYVSKLTYFNKFMKTHKIEGGVSKSMLKKSRLNFDKIEKCK